MTSKREKQQLAKRKVRSTLYYNNAHISVCISSAKHNIFSKNLTVGKKRCCSEDFPFSFASLVFLESLKRDLVAGAKMLALISILALCPTLIAGSSVAAYLKAAESVKDEYIVVLRDGYTNKELLKHVQEVQAKFAKDDLKNVHSFFHLARHGFPAYSARLSSSGLERLLRHPDVKYIEQNAAVHANPVALDKLLKEGVDEDGWLSEPNKKQVGLDWLDNGLFGVRNGHSKDKEDAAKETFNNKHNRNNNNNDDKHDDDHNEEEVEKKENNDQNEEEVYACSDCQNYCRSTSVSGMGQQNSAVWGLARTTSVNRLDGNNYKYYYQSGKLGAGVNAFVVDTGIACSNRDFTTKSAGWCRCGFVGGNSWGSTGTCTTDTDGNGHGTHVASTIAGQEFGVAKEANLIAVKVLNADGSGTVTGVIQGLNWVASQGSNVPGHKIACMSLGGNLHTAFNQAVNSLAAAGVAVVVAAGNANSNSCNFSPASASFSAGGGVVGVLSVGATTREDQRASYSNYGSCVDIFGPGTAIQAAWIGSSDAVRFSSGTSMATPHVVGVMAKIASMAARSGRTLSVEQMYRELLNSALSGKIDWNTLAGSPNLLAYALCN
eukprot:g1077.t1